MELNDEHHVSRSHYAVQLQKAQQNLKQFIPKYRRLVDVERRLRQENRQLREEIEYFNQSLVQREQDLEYLQTHVNNFQAVVQRIHQEEQRSPALHARPLIRQQFFPHHADSTSIAGEIPVQDILPLNIWLVSRNRFIEQIISYYARHRERLLVLERSGLVRQLLEVGFFPDIIITGAYDFGLDDPFQQSFTEMLDEFSRRDPNQLGLQECFIITLSASIPTPSARGLPSRQQHERHKYISKLHGLHVTISEVRFFLELRRCQQDIMQADKHLAMGSLKGANPVITGIKRDQKTGVLVILSHEAPAGIRWALQLFFLYGKLVKTEHTLESSVLLTEDNDVEIQQDGFAQHTLNAHPLNPPHQLFFFPLYQQTVLRETHTHPLQFVAE